MHASVLYVGPIFLLDMLIHHIFTSPYCSSNCTSDVLFSKMFFDLFARMWYTGIDKWNRRTYRDTSKLRERLRKKVIDCVLFMQGKDGSRMTINFMSFILCLVNMLAYVLFANFSILLKKCVLFCQSWNYRIIYCRKTNILFWKYWINSKQFVY